MAFNPSFAGSSGVENFYNNSVDFGSLYNAAATQDALERLNAIKREGSTFNNIIGADARSIMEKYRMEGQQNLHDAQMFSQNLGSAAGFLSSGIGAFGEAGGFGFKPDPVGSQGNPYGNTYVPGPGGSAIGGGRVPLNAG